MLQWALVVAGLLLLAFGAIRWMTTKEAAEELGMSRSGVIEMIRRGDLPAEKFGRDYRINADDLKAVQEQEGGWPRGKRRKPEA